MKSVVGEQGWSRGLHDNIAKLDLIHVLQSATNSEDPIGIADAMELLVELDIVNEESAKTSFHLSAQVLPTDLPLTAKVLSSMLAKISTSHPNSTDSHKKEVAEDLDAMEGVPDTQMTTGGFLQFLSDVFFEPAPDLGGAENGLPSEEIVAAAPVAESAVIHGG